MGHVRLVPEQSGLGFACSTKNFSLLTRNGNVHGVAGTLSCAAPQSRGGEGKMDGEFKGMLWIVAGVGLIVLFIFVCAPALGIHIPVPVLK